MNNIQKNPNDNRQSSQLNKSSVVLSPLSRVQTPQNGNNINNININNSMRPLKSQPIAQPKGDANNLVINQDLNIEGLSKLNYPNYKNAQIMSLYS